MSKIVDAARSLPKDPGLAIVTFAERALAIHPAAHTMKPEDSEFAINFVEQFTTKFIKNVSFKIRVNESRQAFAHRILQDLNGDTRLISNVILGEVDDIINDFINEHDETFGLARLNEEERAKIHVHIDNVRAIIGASILSDRKKNALYERLNRLASEVDAHGTRTERFFSFMGDIAFVMDDMADKAKPLFKEVKEMMRIVARSRARQEGVSLPPGDDVILLPKPEDEA